ncbi:hypothetical protein SH501x_000833 [Pirellulaceae bacterium SH501]|jgi:hypothetical protein
MKFDVQVAMPGGFFSRWTVEAKSVEEACKRGWEAVMSTRYPPHRRQGSIVYCTHAPTVPALQVVEIG